MCVGEGMSRPQHRCGRSKDDVLKSVLSFFLLCGSWGSNSGRHVGNKCLYPRACVGFFLLIFLINFNCVHLASRLASLTVLDTSPSPAPLYLTSPEVLKSLISFKGVYFCVCGRVHICREVQVDMCACVWRGVCV